MEQPVTPTRPSNILIVEDEFLIAMDLRKLLRENGYNVIGPVATVTSALMVLEQVLPHACVLDVNLRGEFSTSVASMLRQLQVPFVLSSAYEQESLQGYAAFAGIENIGKTASSDRLLTALSRLLQA